jgi:hypothetical protein
MTAAVPDDTPAPSLHADSGAVRFAVDTEDGMRVGASISKEVLHYRYKAAWDGADALATYLAHRAEIDQAVRRRVAAGSIEPVMLRETDLAAPVRR